MPWVQPDADDMRRFKRHHHLKLSELRDAENNLRSLCPPHCQFTVPVDAAGVSCVFA